MRTTVRPLCGSHWRARLVALAPARGCRNLRYAPLCGRGDVCRSATYVETRDTYLAAAQALKLATGPYKASRDAYVAATATYTKSLYE